MFKYTVPEEVTELQENQIFVFDSNDQGQHLGGAAKTAVEKFGAIMGQARGLQGQSYAIVTVGEDITLETIQREVEALFTYARANRQDTFLMTKIGTGIASFAESEIKQLFRLETPSNIWLPTDWECRKYVFAQFKNGLSQIVRISDGELGGLVEREENLTQVSDDAWVAGNARVWGNAQVSGNAWVWGDAWVSGDAQVAGNAWVWGDAWVSGNAQVAGDAWVSGNARVWGNAQVSGNAWLLTGIIQTSLEDITQRLAAQCFVAPIDGKVTLYKRVNKVKQGEYASCYDQSFIYHDGKVAEVSEADPSDASCSTGIHVSHPFYWKEGDTIIACEVAIEDVITVQEGKARCRKVKVLGEVLPLKQK